MRREQRRCMEERYSGNRTCLATHVRLQDRNVGQLCSLSKDQSDHHCDYHLSATESDSVGLCKESRSEAETESERGNIFTTILGTIFS